MDIFPQAAQPDRPVQTLQATPALHRLSKKSHSSQARRLTSSANVDDPTGTLSAGRSRSTVAHVLKSSLVELATLDGEFNNAWIKEFSELYFNPVPLKRICYVLCLGFAAVSVTDYFDKIVEKGYHERLGIAEHPEEPFWQLMRTIGLAIPGASSVISLGLLSIRCLRRFSTQNYSGIVFLSLFFPFIGLCISSTSIVRHWGVSTYRWHAIHSILENRTYAVSFSELIIQNLTYNVSFSEDGLPTVSCRDTNAAARLLAVNFHSLYMNGCEPTFFDSSSLIVMFSSSVLGSSLHCGPKYLAFHDSLSLQFYRNSR
jgi:hypothetical protein